MPADLLETAWPAVASPLLHLPFASRLEVEIGCGNGHFLCEYAAERREATLVGIDIKKKRCLKAQDKAERRGYRNVVIINASAEKVLQDLPGGSVDAFHIYFPDPWPKSRHRKRRFFTMGNLLIMHNLLKEGGRLHFGTDFFDYYIQAKVLVALHPGFSITEEPAPAPVLSSLYGRKFVGVSKQILIFSAVKTAAASVTAGSTDEKRQEEEHQRDVDGRVEDDEER
ncbi:MAG: tRNA (guanine(46)-N(7))-methyltransferase TrmB [Spirochaetia bacterium]